MTRERWEQILFAHVPDEVVQDMLNAYVLEIESENAKLRKLVKRMHRHIKQTCDVCDEYYCSNFDDDNECCVFDVLARELGIEVE